MQLRDADAAMAVVDPGVKVDIPPLGVIGGRDELQAVLADIFQAFPDLLVTVRNVINTGDVVTAEFKLEGTQTADYAGVVNQEKHLDVDQAWRFTVADDRIVGIEAYWCQNQLYRRLAVKRLDQIAIV
jgi:predicted ester cyclase